MEVPAPTGMKYEKMIIKWENMIKDIPGNKSYELIYDFNFINLGYLSENGNYILSNTNCILYDGIGYAFGKYSKDEKWRIGIIGYPKVSELTSEQLSLIESKEQILFSDCFKMFGKIKELINRQSDLT